MNSKDSQPKNNHQPAASEAAMNDFMAEMADVQPLEQDKALLDKKAQATDREEQEQLALKRRWAEQEQRAATDPLSNNEVAQVSPFDVLEFRSSGVQEGVFRKLRLGKYDIDARLDLHRLNVAEARKEVFGFLQEAQKYDLRTVLIMHGKGDRDPDPAKKALLKSHTVHWLRQLDSVLAFHSAQQRDGGTGAVYVLLRKSAEAKQHNRETYGLR